MKVPTADEIEWAWHKINEAGPMAPERGALSILTFSNERLSEIVERVVKTMGGHMNLTDTSMLRPLVIGAIATGLNYGMRIGEARLQAERGRKV